MEKETERNFENDRDASTHPKLDILAEPTRILNVLESHLKREDCLTLGPILILQLPLKLDEPLREGRRRKVRRGIRTLDSKDKSSEVPLLEPVLADVRRLLGSGQAKTSIIRVVIQWNLPFCIEPITTHGWHCYVWP